MRRVKVDSEPDSVKTFVRSLSRGSEGSIVELQGEDLLCVAPMAPVDHEALKAALLKRRDASRLLNEEWEAA